MKTLVESISPTRAKEILLANNGNRLISWGWVRKLAGMMTRGEWLLTHQGIAFDVYGVLIDGQHRLEAIIIAGVTVHMAITYNCEPISRNALDQGKGRSIADLMGGSKTLTQPAAFLSRLVWGNNATPVRIQRVHAALGDTPTMLENIVAKHRKVVSSTPVRAAAVLQLYRGENPKYILSTFDLIASSKTEDPNMPPIAHAFIRQATGLVPRYYLIQNRQRDLFVRSLFVFNEAKKNLTSLTVKNAALHLDEVKLEVVAMAAEKEITTTQVRSQELSGPFKDSRVKIAVEAWHMG